jgi:hypothetical protein
MNTQTEAPKPTTDHILTALNSVRDELAKLGVEVTVSRKNEFVFPTMKHEGLGYMVTPGIEFSGQRYNGTLHHVLVIRRGYFRGATHRFKVKPDGSVNAKGIAAQMADKIKHDLGEPARRARDLEQRKRAKEVVEKVREQSGMKDGSFYLEEVQTANPDHERVGFRFNKTLTPVQAIALVRAIRSVGIDI